MSIHASALSCVILVTAGLLSGCQVLPNSPVEQQLSQIPEPTREHVYVYLVEPASDGVAHNGRMHEMARRLHDSGYHNAEYFAALQDGGSGKLASRIRLVREQDPDAKVMLVGWGNGSKTVFKALKELDEDSVVVDRVMYIDSSSLKSATKKGHPQNVTRSVLAYRPRTELPKNVPNAVVHIAPVKSHREVATHPSVYNIMLSEVRDMSVAPATGAQLSRAANPHGVRLTSYPKSMRKQFDRYKKVVRN